MIATKFRFGFDDTPAAFHTDFVRFDPTRDVIFDMGHSPETDDQLKFKKTTKFG